MKDLQLFISEARAAKIDTWPKFLEAIKNLTVEAGFKFIGKIAIRPVGPNGKKFEMPEAKTVMFIDGEDHDDSRLFVHVKDGQGISVLVQQGSGFRYKKTATRGRLWVEAGYIDQIAEKGQTHSFRGLPIYVLDMEPFKITSNSQGISYTNQFDPGKINQEQVQTIISRIVTLCSDKCIDRIFGKWMKKKKNSNGFDVHDTKYNGALKNAIYYSDIIDNGKVHKYKMTLSEFIKSAFDLDGWSEYDKEGFSMFDLTKQYHKSNNGNLDEVTKEVFNQVKDKEADIEVTIIGPESDGTAVITIDVDDEHFGKEISSSMSNWSAEHNGTPNYYDRLIKFVKSSK